MGYSQPVSETIVARATTDPGFRAALLADVIDCEAHVK
jgi:hypothetical protein